MYKEGRESSGLTLYDASCRLHVSHHTLKKYENGQLRTPPDVVLRMGPAYDRPELPLRHCAEKCPIGRVYHPVFDLGDIATGTLRLMSELQDVNNKMGSLVSIAADGKITPEELPEFEIILKELAELGEAIERMKLLGIKRKAIRKGVAA